MLTVRVTGLGSINKLVQDFIALQKRSADYRALHADSGWYMRNMMRYGVEHTSYQKIKPWPRDYRAAGRPLIHKRRLLNSISYASNADLSVSGTMDPAAAIHDQATTIRPKRGKWLAIPLSPPLTASQCEQYRNARYPGGFVIAPTGSKRRGKTKDPGDDTGYTGPGVYRKKGKLIERVKAFVKSVRSTRRSLTDYPLRFVYKVPERWVEYIATGKFQSGFGAGPKPQGEGSPIVSRA